MTKLHEILACEGDIQATAQSLMTETINTFSKKVDHFIGQTRRLTMIEESRQAENAEEDKPLVTTVLDKLDYIKRPVCKYWDTLYRKESTNQHAAADLIVDGTVLAKDVPATYLLGMERRLKDLRDMVLTAPTLNPSATWERDEVAGPGRWRSSKPEKRLKTEKVLRFKVMVEPQDKHPAQVEKWFEDAPVGTIEVQSFSGMLPPAGKSRILERIDNLILAVKSARQRANTAEVTEDKIAEVLWTYMFG